MILLNGGLKMKKTLGKIYIALTILVLFLSMLGVLFIFTYDFRILISIIAH